MKQSESWAIDCRPPLVIPYAWKGMEHRHGEAVWFYFKMFVPLLFKIDLSPQVPAAEPPEEAPSRPVPKACFLLQGGLESRFRLPQILMKQSESWAIDCRPPLVIPYAWKGMEHHHGEAVWFYFKMFVPLLFKIDLSPQVPAAQPPEEAPSRCVPEACFFFFCFRGGLESRFRLP